MSPLQALTARQMLGGGRIWILAAFLSLPVLLLLATVLARGFNFPDQGAVAGILLYVLYPQSLCILATLLYGSSLLAAEIEDKTLVYLFTRSLPRWRVLVDKYVAIVLVLTALTGTSMSVSFLLLGAPVGARLWLALMVTILCATLSYTAIFALLGLLVPRRAIPVGLIYAVVVEFVLSFVPALVNELAASHYLRSLAFHIARIPLPDAAMQIVGGATLSDSILALLVIPLLSLSLSAWIVHRREWPLTEGV